MLQALKRFAAHHSPEVIENTYKIECSFSRAHVTNAKQTTLIDYFKK